MSTLPAEALPARAAPAALTVALSTALAYALVGGLALCLAGPPGYASLLYPSAGIALVAVLVYGRAALPGVWLGSLAVNAGLAIAQGHGGPGMLLLPAFIGLGAALQAGLGAVLVKRAVAQPLVLNEPRDILRFGLYGALVACFVSPSVATPALLASGAIASDGWAANWLTWWVGDTLGVLIGAPLALTLIGRPRADWQPRRRAVGLPLVLVLALLAAGMHEFARLDRQRVEATFLRNADRMASVAQTRLGTAVYALEALHSSARVQSHFDRETLHQAAQWWLAQGIPVQAVGYSERVLLADVAAFQAHAQDAGDTAFKVFDRDGGAARAADGEVLALRHIEPMAGNAGGLGVNSLSVPAARAAALAARDSGQPAASAGFTLTQSSGNETGIVLYQALYRGEPTEVAARRAQFRGVVFITLRAEQALADLAGPRQQYLRWCLVDTDLLAERRRLAGPPGCETQAATAGGLQAQRLISLAGRSAELRIAAPAATAPGQQRETTWLLSALSMGAAAMMGALLLIVTGHSRRTAVAVQLGTADLRREMAERSQAESALRESEARLRTILDNVPLGVMFLDPQGTLIDCNPRLCEMVGQAAPELRGSSVADLVHPTERQRLRGLHRALLAEPTRTLRSDLRLRDKGSHGLVVRMTASALFDPQGRVLRMVGVLEDITEHRRLEASELALQRSEAASRAKSEFVSRMSHELRTPLNAMIGFAQLLGLDRQPDIAPHQREWVQQIQRAGWHLLEMINETLDLARIESGAVQLSVSPLALTPLVAACQALVGTVAGQRRISLSQTVDPAADAVLADATRLKQILTNLLSNAVKYNRDGGAVTLTAQRVPAADGQGGQGSDSVEIAVADTGMGMTPEQLALLFQPYNRLGREGSGIEGTGIGLVISRRLAELMGGTLQARSQAGVGATFTLRLPAAPAAEVAAVRADLSAATPYPHRLVHYVEDNPTNIEVMRGVLAQRAQIRLETSTLGLDGLAAIRARRPDLILLDMQLPDIPGIELLRHLKQDDALAGIPVVVVSADATPAHVEQALVAGAARYVTKPVDLASFLQIVDTLLEDIPTQWG